MNDAIPKLRDVDAKCPFALSMEDALDTNEMCKLFTVQAIAQSRKRAERKKNLGVLKDKGVKLPTLNRLALCDREVEDIKQDCNLFTSVAGAEKIYDIITAYDKEFQNGEGEPQGDTFPHDGSEFDLQNPKVRHVEGTAEQSGKRFKGLMVSSVCRGLAQQHATNAVGGLEALLKYEELTAECDYGQNETIVKTYEDVLILIRCLAACFNPGLMCFHPEVKTCMLDAKEAKVKGMIDNECLVISQAITSVKALDQNRKRILDHFDNTDKHKKKGDRRDGRAP